MSAPAQPRYLAIRVPVTRVLAALALAAVVLAGARAEAGEVVGFSQATHSEVLPHVRWKSVVAEFLDPGDSGLGKSLGYLLWRETLTAISDQAGAGVILARPPGGERIVDMLRDDYHIAALEIARHQNAQMTLWGVVTEDEGRVIVDSYLTLLPEVRDGALRLAVVDMQGRVTGLGAEIQRTRFHFRPQDTSRAALFERRIVTRARTALRAAPDAGAAVVATVGADTALDAVGLTGPWFEVRRRAGEVAYVSLDAVDVPPPLVSADRRAVNLRGGPGTDHARVARVDLAGRYKVLDMRYRPNHGLWYRLQVGDASGWVAAFLTTRHFSLPVVHFVAGLYRYKAGRYDDAAQEFQRFIDEASAQGENVNLAAAYQLLGASRLLSAGRTGPPNTDLAVGAFATAKRYTPYDPAAYTFLALSRLSGGDVDGRGMEAALLDLETALRLDRGDRAAVALAEGLATALKDPVRGLPQLDLLRRSPTLRGRVEALTK